MPSKTLSPTGDLKEILFKAGPYLAAALWVIIMWLAVTDLLEMAVTEWRYLHNSLPGSWRLGILALLLLLSTGILTAWQNTKKHFSLPVLIVTSVLFICSLVGHWAYAKHYQWLQQFPKLKSISTMGTIQGQKVEIIGKNFGQPGNGGTVKVGDLEFLISYWDDEKVVAEQPVPSRYFVDDMVFTNAYGKQFVIEGFSIKDPSELWQ